MAVRDSYSAAVVDWSDGPVRVLVGSARKRLRDLPDESVHVVCTSPPYWGLRSYLPNGHESKDQELGTEATPAEYVAALVDVFREVRRVLRPDGTVWLNVGDSLRAKDLALVPERLAIALQDDGWYIRSRICWAKTSPMPESVRDRPTSAWEHVWLLTKRESYYFDQEAVREPATKGADGSTFTNGKTGVNGLGRTSQLPRGESSGRNMRNFWLLGPEPYPDAHFACVDEETDCLTFTGWKQHHELRAGELVASYSMEDGRLRWRPLEAVASYHVTDEPLVYAEGASLRMALTRNHRCVVKRRKMAGGLSGPKIKRADELAFADRILTAAPWDETGEPFDPSWAELLGWYVAEGHAIRGSMDVEISQSLSVNAPKVDRIRNLLVAVGADWSEATGHREWRGRETFQTWFRVHGYAAARLRELAPHKRLCLDVLAWNSVALVALMGGLIGGDGHMRQDGRMSFIQNNIYTANLVQAIAARLGWSAALRRRQGGMYTVYFTKHVTRSLRGTGGKGARLELRSYTGVVWCPKTPDGTWVARRDGYVFITGNTFPSEIPRRAIAAGTSERGCCPECGAPWRRVVERGLQPRDMSRPQARRAVVLAARAGLTDQHILALQAAGATDAGKARMTQAGYGKNTAAVIVLAQEAKTALGGYHREFLLAAPATTGWRPGCAHDHDPIPCTALDPFAGSGTTLAVARRMGRVAIGIELNPEYLPLIQRRVAEAATPLLEVPTVREPESEQGLLFAEVGS